MSGLTIFRRNLSLHGLVDVEALDFDEANALVTKLTKKFRHKPFDYACVVYENAAKDMERHGIERVKANLRSWWQWRAE